MNPGTGAKLYQSSSRLKQTIGRTIHPARAAGDTARAAAIKTVDDFSLACAAVAEHWLASFAVPALGDAP